MIVPFLRLTLEAMVATRPAPFFRVVEEEEEEEEEEEAESFCWAESSV